MANTKTSALKSMNKLVTETRSDTVKELFDFLAERVPKDFTEELESLCEDFKLSVKVEPNVNEKKKDKTKRPPTVYNLFVAEKMAEFKEQHAQRDDGTKFDGRGAMTKAAQLYSATKGTKKPKKLVKAEDIVEDEEEENTVSDAESSSQN